MVDFINEMHFANIAYFLSLIFFCHFIFSDKHDTGILIARVPSLMIHDKCCPGVSDIPSRVRSDLTQDTGLWVSGSTASSSPSITSK